MTQTTDRRFLVRPGGSRDMAQDWSKKPGSTYPAFWRLDSQALAELYAQKGESTRPPSLAATLSLALAYLNKQASAASSSLAVSALSSSLPGKEQRQKLRLIVLSCSQDEPSEYIPLMNCFFSAQKMGCTIDVCCWINITLRPHTSHRYA